MLHAYGSHQPGPVTEMVGYRRAIFLARRGLNISQIDRIDTAGGHELFAELLTARLPPSAIGGPLMIYHLTGVAARGGSAPSEAKGTSSRVRPLRSSTGALRLSPSGVRHSAKLERIGAGAER